MALKKCKECGNQVSTKADKCPKCGAPIKKSTRIGCLGSIVVIIFALIIIGQISNYFEEKTKQKEIREKARIAEQRAEDTKKQQAELRERNIKFFKANKTGILAELTSHYENGNYQNVIAMAEPYLASGDADLKGIYEKAKPLVDEFNRKKREQEILQQLKQIPASQFERNKNLYQELLSLSPNEAKYKQKYEYYAAKLEEERTKQEQAAERNRLMESQFSAWDGSHRNLERFIKKAMNDPSSYDHVETVYWDMGDHLIVRTTFRGKNAFGGIVKNSVKAKVDLNGNILEIIEQY